jgi:hypothetical protein
MEEVLMIHFEKRNHDLGEGFRTPRCCCGFTCLGIRVTTQACIALTEFDERSKAPALSSTELADKLFPKGN